MRGGRGKREKREGEKSGNSFRRFVISCLIERRERENLGLKIEGGGRGKREKGNNLLAAEGGRKKMNNDWYQDARAISILEILGCPTLAL